VLFVPRGVLRRKSIETFDDSKITEQIECSWYPRYTGLKLDEKYSWMKAPRYDGEAMEVGPLARMLVAYAGGQQQVKTAVDAMLAKLGLGAGALVSTVGRVVARGIEAQLLAARIGGWVDELADNMARRELRIADIAKWEPGTWPKECAGIGLHEAPRGALAHRIAIKERKIGNYDIVAPSTWNGSPRDAAKKRGPFEEALLGTPVADPSRPVELLRTIHSFNPCIACGVH